MEEIIEVDKPIETKKHPVIGTFFTIISTLVSFFLAGFSFYIASKGTGWFVPLGIYFFFDGLIIFIALCVKDVYKAMHLEGLKQVVSVIFVMTYLLVMVLWNDPNKVMDYSYNAQYCLLIAFFIKLALAFFSNIVVKKSYDPFIHAFRNNSLLLVFNSFLLMELIIFNYLFPGNTTDILANVLKEKPLWAYIFIISSNALLTVLAALLSLSTAIRAKVKEEVSTGAKIKHTVRWFNDNEVSMFIGTMFTLYLAILALIHMKQNFFYILLFIYYIGTISIRIINYLWHRRIQKKCGDNIIRDNRLSSWILLFDAFNYLFFSIVLAAAAIFVMIQKVEANTNMYLFLFILLPLAFIRFVTANKSIERHRRENNTYRLAVSLIGLVSVFFSILEIVAIAMHNFPIVWLRYVFIILAMLIAQICVIVVAIVFVLHWFRSLVLNSRSKEREAQKAKDQ